MSEKIQEIVSTKEEFQHEQPKKNLASKIMSLLPNHPIFHYRTPFDKSEYSCLVNILLYTGKSFLGGFGPSAVLSIISVLKKYKELKDVPTLLFHAIFNSKNVKVGLFMGSFTFIFKTTITIMRIIRKKDDGMTGSVAGFLAGWLSLFFLEAKRAFVACYLLSRGLDTIYNSKVANRKLKKSRLHAILAFGLLGAFVAHAWLHEGYLLSPDMKKYLDNLAKLTVDRMDMLPAEIGSAIKTQKLIRSNLL